MSITPTGPYRFPSLGATAGIAPFTLRDGASFLEKLEVIAQYVDSTLRVEFETALEKVVAEFNASLDTTGTAWATDFAAYRADLNGVLMGLNDESMQTLTDDPASATGAAIRNLITTLSASDADLTALSDMVDETLAALTTETAAAKAVTDQAIADLRATTNDHSARHEYAGADELKIDVRQVVSPVRDYARTMLRESSFAPFRIVFTGDSHTNDGSLERPTGYPGVPEVWGGGTGYSWRVGNLLTNEGMSHCDANTVATTNSTAGVHTWESSTGGMRSDTFMPSGTIANIGRIKPHLLTMFIGTNDFAAQTSPALFRTNVDNALSAVWSVSPETRVVLMIPFPRVNPAGMVHQWRAYVDQLLAIGTANRTNPRFELFDYGVTYERLSMPLKPNLWGVFPDDIHGDRRAHRELAEKFAEWLGLPSPLAVFGPTRIMPGKPIRAGRLTDLNPHSTIDIEASAVPREVTFHVNLLGVVDAETDIRINVVEDFAAGYIGELHPYHVQPASLRSYFFTRTIYVPAHEKRNCYLSGGDGFNVFAGAGYDQYNGFHAELNYA